jgi:hypothetical protein
MKRCQVAGASLTLRFFSLDEYGKAPAGQLQR